MAIPQCCNMCSQCAIYYDNMGKRVFQCAKAKYYVIGSNINTINQYPPNWCAADENDGLKSTKYSDWENDW